ncbi:MAG TPA: CoA-transferase [Mycobacteriales bacterium]
MTGSVFVSSTEAAALVPSGATVAFCGSAKVGVPEAVLNALGQRFGRSGEPAGLTLYFPVESGDRRGVGMEHLAQPGMLRRLVAGAFIFTGTRQPAETTRMVLDNEVEAYNLPMGVMYHLLREVAAGRPGLITRVGLGTFVEPDLGGGKLNARTTEDLVEYVEIAGERFLRYRPIPIDVAIIRGTTADEDGNISMEREASLQGVLVMAQAAKASGGVVIAEVMRRTGRGTINPQAVRVPGMLVDAVVVNPDQQQLVDEPYRPSLSGEGRIPVDELVLPEMNLAARVIARRAIQELSDGWNVNLGFGLGAYIPTVLTQEFPGRRMAFFVEQGAAGGVPLPGGGFGASVNPSSIVEMPSWFDFLDSGAFDATCLGWGEVDAEGSVRNHQVGAVLSGCGGFIDITSRVPRIVYCGTFTAGGLQTTFQDGRLIIQKEGRHQKFVPHISAPTMSGPMATARGQRVTYITERAVFELRPDGLALCELAPGIDLETIRDLIPFDILVADDLHTMDPGLFAGNGTPGPGPVSVAAR